MVGLRAAERLVLRAACRLVADQVGVGAAEARRAHRLVGVDHDLVVGGPADGIEVVVVHPLPVMVLAAGQDVAHVPALDRVVPVFVHQAVGRFHVAFVVAHRSRRFMVHHQPDAFPVRIFVQCGDVEIGVGGHEIEDVILRVPEPVLPADVPAFDEQLVEPVCRREVDVPLHVLVVGAVAAAGPASGVIRHAELYRRHVARIGPVALAGDHFPPYAHVFHGLDPRGVVIGARLVEVQDQLRGEDVAGVVRDRHRAPRGMAGRLHVAFPPLCVGRKVRGEDEIPVVQVEVHARIVDQRRFVDVDVEPVVALHLQGRLYARGREGRLRRVGRDGAGHQLPYLREFRFGVVVLLRVVVARDPERRVVARHGELCFLLADDEIGQRLLFGEFVAESEPVVVEPEADRHVAACRGLPQRDGHFVIAVADLGLLAPYGTPCLVGLAAGHLPEGEPVVERYRAPWFALADFSPEFQLRGFAAQFEPHAAGQDHGALLVIERIGGAASVRQAELQAEAAVGREERLLCRAGCTGQQRRDI